MPYSRVLFTLDQYQTALVWWTCIAHDRRLKADAWELSTVNRTQLKANTKRTWRGGGSELWRDGPAACRRLRQWARQSGAAVGRVWCRVKFLRGHGGRTRYLRRPDCRSALFESVTWRRRLGGHRVLMGRGRLKPRPKNSGGRSNGGKRNSDRCVFRGAARAFPPRVVWLSWLLIWGRAATWMEGRTLVPAQRSAAQRRRWQLPRLFRALHEKTCQLPDQLPV